MGIVRDPSKGDFHQLLCDVNDAIGAKCYEAEVRYVANKITNDVAFREIVKAQCIAGFYVSLEPLSFDDWRFGSYINCVRLHSGRTVYWAICYE